MQILNEPSTLAAYINRHGLIDILPEAVLEVCELCRYGRDESVLVAGTEMEYFYFFIKGKLKVFQIHDNGKAFLIQFYSMFDSLGEVELLVDMETSCSVTAVEISDLIRIPMATMRKHVMDYPAFLEYSARSLATKLIIADRHHASNLLYPVKNRLASYLMAHAVNSESVKLKESLSDVSEYIGTTYRQLHRAFSQLMAEKIIEREGKLIKILDSKKLSKLAGTIYGNSYSK